MTNARDLKNTNTKTKSPHCFSSHVRKCPFCVLGDAFCKSITHFSVFCKRAKRDILMRRFGMRNVNKKIA